MTDVQLKIVLPYKVLPVEKAAKIVVPAEKGMLTVLKDRAPTTLLLTNGVVEILNEHNEVTKRYFVQGGVANIAADECVIMTQKALNAEELNKSRVEEMKAEHLKELQDLQKAFPGQSQLEDDEMKFYDFVSQKL